MLHIFDIKLSWKKKHFDLKLHCLIVVSIYKVPKNTGDFLLLCGLNAQIRTSSPSPGLSLLLTREES